MSLERTNLLPPARIRASHRNYFIRLGTVAVVGAIGVLLVHTVFLVPSYIFLESKIKAETHQLNELKQTLASSGAQTVQGQLATLEGEATYLQQLSSAPSVSTSVQSILGVARPGVRLTGFTYAAPKGDAPGTLQVSGIAASREQLRSYIDSLGALPFVTKTDLPISVYAQATDIPFTATLTGTFMP